MFDPFLVIPHRPPPSIPSSPRSPHHHQNQINNLSRRRQWTLTPIVSASASFVDISPTSATLPSIWRRFLAPIASLVITASFGTTIRTKRCWKGQRAYVEVTLCGYLVHSEGDHGFLIEDQDLYIVYNDRRRQLNVNGFWIDCDLAKIETPPAP